MTQREQYDALQKYRGLVGHALNGKTGGTSYRKILSNEDYDELESDCLAAIFAAIESYDPDHPSGAKVETLIYFYIRKAICHFVDLKARKRSIFNDGTISLSTTLGTGPTTLEDELEGHDGDHTDRLQLEAAIASIHDPDRRAIVERVSGGETMRAIGRDYGVTRGRIFQIKEQGVKEMQGNVGRKRTDPDSN